LELRDVALLGCPEESRVTAAALLWSYARFAFVSAASTSELGVELGSDCGAGWAGRARVDDADESRFAGDRD
jgi:hypothetical protein